MNKVAFLVLFLFSIQGFASSCPDGSEPAKSISEDGTYFVFNCEALLGSLAENSEGTTFGKSI